MKPAQFRCVINLGFDFDVWAQSRALRVVRPETNGVAGYISEATATYFVCTFFPRLRAFP